MSLSATGWGWGKYLVNCEITKCGPSSPNHHQVRTQISINSQNNIEDVLGRNNWLTTWPTFVIVTEGSPEIVVGDGGPHTAGGGDDGNGENNGRA